MVDSVQNQTPIINSPYYYQNALTPESMMVYLSTRLGSVDEQIQTLFKDQQKSEDIRKALNAIQQELNTLGTSTKKEEILKGSEDVLKEVTKIIDEQIALVDPQLATDMKARLQSDNYILEGKESQYQTVQLETTKDYLNDLTGQLESTAQMNMIHLQSMMSARQTAISLATNLLAKLDESTKKVVDNIR